jgi:hypothetical protein
MRNFALLLLLTAGCGGASGAREPDEYTGCGTDEHWRTFDDQEPHLVPNDDNAPQVTSPQTGATLSATAPPVFGWNQSPSSPGTVDGDVPYMNGPDCNMCCPEFNLGALTTLHKPPASGSVYDLQFFIDGNIVHRVVTTLQEWAPKSATWASFRGHTVTLKVFRAALLRNDVKEGPFVSTTPFTFTVGH